MSTKVLNIIEQMKTLTLVEAAELFREIEHHFGVEASPLTVKFGSPGMTEKMSAREIYTSEMSTQEIMINGIASPAIYNSAQAVDVILEFIPPNRKTAITKVVWNVTGVGFKQAKLMVKKPPVVLKESIPSHDAMNIKKYLESFGAKVSLQ
ncbi:ribosomal protein L7/L12 [Spirulina subsalsa FACHB-351]|uniref:50S ribosomal protein L7/L12 n=1 Tax=Spirulina subsalsa FACHB-351 TaxID=234711 RepID=A0ABT3KZL3_9CYAN|nr:ribosomal protein L7/L12 [Spirulina subsalsa]MCW6034693.1 ribosomal protein L7/L12 [Spirulina subsalsa FACHB-351]